MTPEPGSPIGRVLFLTLTVAANTTSTVTKQATVTGRIVGLEVSIPTTNAVTDLQFAIIKNVEQIYPDQGLALRAFQGDDDANINTEVSEGDNLTLLVQNSSSTTSYTITAKVVLEGIITVDTTTTGNTYPLYTPAYDEDYDSDYVL